MHGSRQTGSRGERGSALVFAILVIVILTLLGVSFLLMADTENRIAASLDEQRFLPERDNYIVNTSEFDDVKGRLAQLENRRKLTNPEDKDRPSLRRTTADNKSGDKSGKEGDDRPTLKRRDND